MRQAVPLALILQGLKRFPVVERAGLYELPKAASVALRFEGAQDVNRYFGAAIHTTKLKKIHISIVVNAEIIFCKPVQICRKAHRQNNKTVDFLCAFVFVELAKAV